MHVQPMARYLKTVVAHVRGHVMMYYHRILLFVMYIIVYLVVDALQDKYDLWSKLLISPKSLKKIMHTCRYWMNQTKGVYTQTNVFVQVNVIQYPIIAQVYLTTNVTVPYVKVSCISSKCFNKIDF